MQSTLRYRLICSHFLGVTVILINLASTTSDPCTEIEVSNVDYDKSTLGRYYLDVKMCSDMNVWSQLNTEDKNYIYYQKETEDNSSQQGWVIGTSVCSLKSGLLIYAFDTYKSAKYPYEIPSGSWLEWYTENNSFINNKQMSVTCVSYTWVIVGTAVSCVCLLIFIVVVIAMICLRWRKSKKRRRCSSISVSTTATSTTRSRSQSVVSYDRRNTESTYQTPASAARSTWMMPWTGSPGVDPLGWVATANWVHRSSVSSLPPSYTAVVSNATPNECDGGRTLQPPPIADRDQPPPYPFN